MLQQLFRESELRELERDRGMTVSLRALQQQCLNPLLVEIKRDTWKAVSLDANQLEVAREFTDNV